MVIEMQLDHAESGGWIDALHEGEMGSQVIHTIGRGGEEPGSPHIGEGERRSQAHQGGGSGRRGLGARLKALTGPVGRREALLPLSELRRGDDSSEQLSS